MGLVPPGSVNEAGVGQPPAGCSGFAATSGVTPVLNVVFDERFGGPQFRILQVARVLRSRGFDTLVAMPKGDPLFSLRLKSAGIAAAVLPLVRLRKTIDPRPHLLYLGKFWPNVRALRHLIRNSRTRVVHTNGFMHLQAAIAASLEGSALVWHLNDVNPVPRGLAAIVPFIKRHAHVIAIASRAVGRHYLGDTWDKHPRVRLLYPPVDMARLGSPRDGAKIRAELGIPPDVMLIGTVGNLDPGKGFEFLIPAAVQIKRRFAAVKFAIAGAHLENRKQYAQQLHRLCGELGVANDVLFLGRRSDIPELLASMTIYVHPSEAEAAPMAVMEASASGLPVVATDVGGTRELVEPGVTGVIVPPRSAGSIAEAVIQLLQHPEAAAEMGKDGRRRMERHFSLEACAAAHAEIYASAIRAAVLEK